MINKIASISIAVFTLTEVTALQAAESGPYVGIAGGVARIKIDESVDAATLATLGATGVSSTTKKENTSAFKLYGGYAINEYVAAELTYFQTGDFKLDANFLPSGTANAKVKYDGFSLDLVGTAPLGESFNVFGRIGVNHSTTRLDETFNVPAGFATGSESHSKTSWKAGVGVGYQFKMGLGVRLEWERYRVDDGTGNGADNLDLVTLGVQYKFKM